MTNLKNLTNEQLVATFQTMGGRLRSMMSKPDTGAMKVLYAAIQQVAQEANARGVSLRAG